MPRALWVRGCGHVCGRMVARWSYTNRLYSAVEPPPLCVWHATSHAILSSSCSVWITTLYYNVHRRRGTDGCKYRAQTTVTNKNVSTTSFYKSSLSLFHEAINARD